MIKKKYKLIIRFNIIGCIFLVLTIFSFVLMHHLKIQGFENASSLAENYEDETIKVGEASYVDIVERPVKICRYSDDVTYYEINDGDRFYIMRSGKDWYDDMMDGIAEDGEFHVVGSVLKISDSDKETIIEHFNDKLPDTVEPWTKESFDDYYKGVCIQYMYPVRMAMICVYVGLVLALFAFLFLLMGIKGFVSFNKTLHGISDTQLQMIDNELLDPATMVIKVANTYLTPRRIVYADIDLAFIPYEEVARAYRSDASYKGVHSVFVTVVTRDGRKHKIAMMNALFKGVNEAVDTILSEIHRRNPNAVIGEEQ
ncbi:hypothetical protein [Butyrivibrio fibrisolvens]|uniref:hypothetical protein n=1 Tax=Butyrivibrio fibrisolvens TaxID=831 RepID=UPI0003B7182C|nr:hypothetical protein [Butyrivibrio fibrisolvens]